MVPVGGQKEKAHESGKSLLQEWEYDREKQAKQTPDSLKPSRK